MNGSVFWKAGVLTLIIFIVGMFFGMWIDTLRVEELRGKVEEVHLALIDTMFQNLYFQIFPVEEYCELATRQNTQFGDRIYLTLGKMLEEYEKVNKFSPELILEKKRYVLLKLQLWFNSIYLKKVCNASYVNLVYFYSHFTKDLNTQLDQRAQSFVLWELKQEYGNKIILIPLPMDMEIGTIEIIKERFNITKAPTILIDEKIKLEGPQSKQKLNEIIANLV